MKLGLNSASLADLNFEEVINYAAEHELSCVEMMCWPVGEVEKRYAGVTHINVSEIDEEKAAYINNYCKSKGVEISALGYYPNPLDPDTEKSAIYIEHIKKIIKAANILGIETITGFIGRDKNKTVEENLELFKEVWTPIVKLAEENNVRIAIENCTKLFTNNEWPGGLNLATTPSIWRRMFELIPSANLGLNYDPAHLVWQKIDYIKPIYEFKDRIFHMHIRDVKVYVDKLNDVGIMATPLQYMAPKLPGLGDIDWGMYVSALTDIRYKGAACLEIKDRAFGDSLESIKKSIIISRNYMNQFLV